MTQFRHFFEAMGLYQLYYSGKSIKFLKDQTTLLSAKIPPALGVSESLSYDWKLTVTTTNVILAFAGAQIKWIYALSDLKEKEYIDLSIKGPTFLPHGVSISAAASIFFAIALIVFMGGMIAGYSTAIDMFTKNPADLRFREAYESAIKHYRQGQKKTLESLRPEDVMSEKDILCNPKDTTDCIKIQNCALVHTSETSVVGNWIPDGGRYNHCHLILQNDGNLVMYADSDSPVVSSATNRQNCNQVTYGDNQFNLHCEGKTITWKLIKSK